jgi:hypothetical protein
MVVKETFDNKTTTLLTLKDLPPHLGRRMTAQVVEKCIEACIQYPCFDAPSLFATLTPEP